MAASHTFRTAFRGFNREDVVRYIEYINNYYNSQLEQLRTQAQPANEDLLARLEAAEARCAELEALLAQQSVDAAEPVLVTPTEQELEAYRRAERAEREAKDRAQQIYTQAHAVLAETTLKAEAASEQFSAISQQITEQMQQYQQSVEDTRRTFQEAVSTLYAIRPEEE